jgi:alkaline phosphatase
MTKIKRPIRLVALLAMTMCAASFQAWAGQAKNVVVLIGDGWGFDHLAASAYYLHGDTGRMTFEQSFAPLACSTYAIEGQYDPAEAWRTFDWFKGGATDSAAAATALATGHKTKSGMLGMTPDKEHLVNLTSFACELGKSAGVITSVQLSHATPAGFVAHNESRGNYAEIAREMIEKSALQVIMGGGHPWYDDSGNPVAEIPAAGLPEGLDEKNYQFVGGPELWARLLEGTAGADITGDGIPNPWTLVDDKDTLVALGSGDTPERLLFVPRVAQTLQCNRESIAPDSKTEFPGQTPRIDTVPTLGQMTRSALNVLDNNSEGFFLMIEGGAIDWASHGNHTGRMIEESAEFYEAIDAVIAWVETHSSWDETLVVITSDHECGYLSGPGSDPGWNPVENRGRGAVPGVSWHSGGHTNMLVPLFVKGPGTDSFLASADMQDPRQGSYLDNTDIPRIISQVMQGVPAPPAEEASLIEQPAPAHPVVRATHAPGTPEVWIGLLPLDVLIGRTPEWAFVASHLDGVKLWTQQIVFPSEKWPFQGGIHTPDALERLMAEFGRIGIPVIQEKTGFPITVSIPDNEAMVGQAGPFDDSIVGRAAAANIAQIQKLKDMGANVTAVDMDGFLYHLINPGAGEYGFTNYDDAARICALWMLEVEKAHPGLRFYELTNFPNWGYQGAVNFQGTMGWGDYDTALRAQIRQARLHKAPLAGVTVDNPYDYILGEVSLPDGRFDPKKVDWVGRVLELERFVKGEGLEFNLIINSQRAGERTPEEYYRETLDFLELYRSRGGKPDRYVVQSWYTQPTRDQVLPETEPHTFMNLVREVITRVKGINP